jgi:alpha/beta superfamily hydrolase
MAAMDSNGRATIPGPAGAIEIAAYAPAAPAAAAVIAHPHPLFGGTMDNKVVNHPRARVPRGGRGDVALQFPRRRRDRRRP